MPFDGISILVDDLFTPSQSSLCLMSKSSFEKPYRQRSQKYVFPPYLLFDHEVIY